MIPLQKLIDLNNKAFVKNVYAFNDGMFALNYANPVGLVVYNYNGNQIIDMNSIPGIKSDALEFYSIESRSGNVNIKYSCPNHKHYDWVHADYNARGQLKKITKKSIYKCDDDVQWFDDVPSDVNFPHMPKRNQNDPVITDADKMFSQEYFAYMQPNMIKEHGVMWIHTGRAAHQLPASHKNMKKRCDELAALIMNNPFYQLSNNGEFPGLFGADDPHLQRTYNFLKNYIESMRIIEQYGMKNNNTEKYDDMKQLLDKRMAAWIKSQESKGK